MKKCPKCNISHEKNGTYCSRSCANSREQTQEIKERKSKKVKDSWNNLSLNKKKERKKFLYNLKPWEEKTFRKRWEDRPIEEYLKSTSNTVKKRVLIERGYLKKECVSCGQGPKYNGIVLTLQLDHINGNNKDNRIENLRILCPNCHSQTTTYAGRNRKGLLV